MIYRDACNRHCQASCSLHPTSTNLHLSQRAPDGYLTLVPTTAFHEEYHAAFPSGGFLSTIAGPIRPLPHSRLYTMIKGLRKTRSQVAHGAEHRSLECLLT